MRKKGMGKAAAVIAAAMLFSLFSEAGMAAPQMVQAATYQKTIKNKSVKNKSGMCSEMMSHAL